MGALDALSNETLYLRARWPHEEKTLVGVGLSDHLFGGSSDAKNARARYRDDRRAIKIDLGHN
jgi:hypothetical protein